MALSSKSFKVSSPSRKIQDVPDATPTISVSDGGAAGAAAFDEVKVSVAYSSPTGGIPDAYRVVANPGNIVTIGGTPVGVRGLTPGTDYTFTATPQTSAGTLGSPSSVSAAETPTGAMVPIARSTLSSSGDFYFTNIPQTFQHLFISVYGRSNQADVVGGYFAGFNNNYGGNTNYSWTTLIANGSSTTSTRNVNEAGLWADGRLPASTSAAGIFGAMGLHILNYRNTSTFKTYLMRSTSDRNGSGETTLSAGVWRSTSAINLIYLTSSISFAAGSTATLYGIKAAS
jgi:hypothetical protein